ncbi:hypothetical protein Tco_1326665 [Tanacetum coccineum]
MTSLADKSLLSGGDNKPPMLEKHLYDSWKSRMELYMMNRPHGRMILASVEKGPLVWPSITEDGVTRLKEYVELTPAEAIQADCDIKAINIILQGLPTEIYALVSQHRVAKDLWEKIKLLMQGTSLTKQERECKLYDEFDKFTYKKGETLHEYYLRFTLLLNDMNIYKMPLEQFQVNTKFLNTLPDEWSKFVTDVKLVKDLHTTNVDQLHAHLQQHERHAIEVRLMHERNPDPLALVASHQLTQPAYQSHLHPHQQSLSQHHVSPYQYSTISVFTAAENVVKNESHFSLEVVDQDLSPLAMFTKHLMSEQGGGSFAKRSMVAKDGLGGDGFVVNGGRSPNTSSKDGEDGGVENKSSMGSRLIATGELVFIRDSGGEIIREVGGANVGVSHGIVKKGRTQEAGVKKKDKNGARFIEEDLS